MFFFGESNSYPLSYNYDSQSFTIQEKNTAFPHHNHHQNLIFGSYYNDHHLPYIPNNPPMLENFMINDPNNVTPLHNSASNKLLLEAPMADQRNSLICPSSVVSHLSSKRSGSSKKDRHTKICTAQGVRDRRIRLSIHIAREFFNLQDMLGFDKASKTLGWLLAKSRYAIDELARASTKANTESTIESEDSIKEINYEKKILSGKTSKKKRAKKGKCKDNNDEIDEKEVRRAKARERARERTKMKKMMMIINLNHQILENLSNQKAQENLMICQSSFAAPLSQITSSCEGYNNQLGIKARISCDLE